MKKEEKRKIHFLARSFYRYLYFSLTNAPQNLLQEEKEIFMEHKKFLSSIEKTVEFQCYFIQSLINFIRDELLQKHNSILRTVIYKEGNSKFFTELKKILEKLNLQLSEDLKIELDNALFEIISRITFETTSKNRTQIH